MIGILLYVILATHSVNQEELLKKEITQFIKNNYKITNKDAWTITDSVMKNSKRYDVPHIYILSVISVESDYNKMAVSSKGAMGLMQLMPQTAAEVAKHLNVKKYNMFEIRDNIRFGTWYLKQMHNIFDDYSLAIRAYNCGHGRVNKVLTGKYNYPSETKDYYGKIMMMVSKIMTSYLSLSENFEY